MNKKILFPTIAAVLLMVCFFAVNANFGTMKQNLNQERYTRLDAERKLDDAVKKLRLLEQQLNDAKRKLDGVQNIVNEGKNTASELKAEMVIKDNENNDLKISIKKLQEELERVKVERDQEAARAAQQNVAQPQATN